MPLVEHSMSNWYLGSYLQAHVQQQLRISCNKVFKHSVTLYFVILLLYGSNGSFHFFLGSDGSRFVLIISFMIYENNFENV